MAKKLVDMKMAPSKSAPYPETVSGEQPAYPWGLSLTIDEQSLEKLGITALPEAGSYMEVRGFCCVTRVSSDQNQNGEVNRSLSLQIEEMAVTAVKDESDTATRLYDKAAT